MLLRVPFGFPGGGVRRNAEEADGRDGEMAERLNAAVLKTAEPSRVPWVRIPLSPPGIAGIVPESGARVKASLGEARRLLGAPTTEVCRAVRF